MWLSPPGTLGDYGADGFLGKAWAMPVWSRAAPTCAVASARDVATALGTRTSSEPFETPSLAEEPAGPPGIGLVRETEPEPAAPGRSVSRAWVRTLASCG